MTEAADPVGAARGAVVRIGTHLRGVDRSYATVLAGWVALVAAVSAAFVIPVAVSPPDRVDLHMLSAAAVPVLLVLRLLWLQVRSWRRARRIEVPLEMDDRFLLVRTPADEVAVPWEKVESITVGGWDLGPQVLRIVVWADDDQSAWLRWGHRDRPSSGHWRKRTLALYVATLGLDVSRLAADVRDCSRGSVEVRWPS